MSGKFGKSRHPGFDNVFREATHEDQTTFDMTPARKPVGADWEKWYRALKQHDPQIYQMAIQSVEAVTLTHGVATKVAAEYERAVVMLVCDMLGVRP